MVLYQCSLAATVPELIHGDVIVQEPTPILNFLRKEVRGIIPVHHFLRCLQEYHSYCFYCTNVLYVFFQRFNADYELSAREGADTMAYIALMDEKLRPALVASPSSAAWRR